MKELEVHIAMIIREKITDISYCGRKHAQYYVTESFRLPGGLVCNICVDEWENEDIRMKSPRKTEKLTDGNTKE